MEYSLFTPIWWKYIKIQNLSQFGLIKTLTSIIQIEFSLKAHFLSNNSSRPLLRYLSAVYPIKRIIKNHILNVYQSVIYSHYYSHLRKNRKFIKTAINLLNITMMLKKLGEWICQYLNPEDRHGVRIIKIFQHFVMFLLLMVIYKKEELFLKGRINKKKLINNLIETLLLIPMKS